MRIRVLALTILGCLMLLLVGLRPISDVDMFWQLKLGQLILKDGRLVTQDPFTFTHAGESFPPLCWLAQVIYALLFQLGESWRLLQIVDNLLFVGAFLLAALSVRGTEARPAAVVAAVVLGFLVAYPHNSLRPQTFALFSFAALFALHASQRPMWVKIVGGGIILVVWQNLHPSVVVAGFGLAALFVAEVWEFYREGRQPEQVRRMATTAALLVLVGGSQFATPMGFDILAVQRRNADLSQHLPHPSTEWLHYWDPRVAKISMPFWLAVAVTVLLWLRVNRQTRPADVLLPLLMLGLAAWYCRFGFFMVALVPAWSRLFDKAMPPTFFAVKEETAATPGGESSSLRGLVAAVFLILTATLTVLLRPQLFKEDVPLAGVRTLRMQEDRIYRIYNFQPFSGPLLLNGQPDWKVLMDGRIYIFSNQEWDEYYQAKDGKIKLSDLERRYAPDAFFLQPEFNAGLVKKLRAPDSAWEEIDSKDVNCCIFVRKKPEASKVADGSGRVP